MTAETRAKRAGKAYVEANHIGFSIDFWEEQLAKHLEEEDLAGAELAKSEIKALKLKYSKALAKYHRYAN